MKATDLLRENSIEKCKSILDDLLEQGHTGDFCNDLERLIKSHEFVESVGGWNDATALYDEYMDKDLGKAIADVGSCQ